MTDPITGALIGLIGIILGGVVTYATAMRRVNADVHIARVTLESESETDDRKALRDYQNDTIAKREAELAECRQRIETLEAVKDRSISVLERLAAEMDARKEGTQQTGGTAL